MRKLPLLILLVLCHLGTFGQKKLIQKFLSNEKDTTRKASFMPIPALGYSQETGFEFGVGALYSFYVDRKDSTNRSSNFSGNASYSTKKTYNVALRGDAWTKHNKYHLIGELRFRKIPFDFYGIGNETAESDADKIVQQMIKVAFDVEKTFIKSAYTGVSIGFENYQYSDKVSGGIYDTSTLMRDRDGGNVLYLGVSQSYDTRNSNNYPTKGFFGRVSFQYAPNLFGGENLTGGLLKVNLRNFWPVADKLVFGLNGVYNSIRGRNIPFYLLPQLGSDELMRGYYTGRYRDENLLVSQAELRYRFSNRFGLAGFIGTGKVFANGNLSFSGFKPNYGFGGRYFFDPAKGLSVRLDYGVGEKKKDERRQSGFYISLAEAF